MTDLATRLDIVMSTLPLGGGATYDLAGQEVSEGVRNDVSGYAVGGWIPGLLLSVGDPENQTILKTFIAAIEKTAAIDNVLLSELFIGLWRGDGDKVFVDAVTVVERLHVAMLLAQLFNQQAIGWFINGEYRETIYVH